MSTTGWMIYAPGESWIEDLLDGPWTLEMVTEPAGSWHGAFFKHCQEQPWEVERRLRTLSGHHAVPMLACYVETSDFGYALALARGELVARYVVNAHGRRLCGRRLGVAGVRSLARACLAASGP